MPHENHTLSFPARLFIRAILNILLVWAMASYLTDYFSVGGGLFAYIVIGALLTFMNIIIRPLLGILALPLKLFAMLLALILINGIFMWLTYSMIQLMDQNLVHMEILGGIAGWVLVSIVFGIGNWLMKMALK
ncbi:MAG: putative rane protein [Candidatus Peribacteria bacterium]|nr:putative rane protein [Candidatus Peribacteria bacterium]